MKTDKNLSQPVMKLLDLIRDLITQAFELGIKVGREETEKEIKELIDKLP